MQGSIVPTRLPPQGERALACNLIGYRIEAVPATPRGHPGLLVQGRQFEAVRRPASQLLDSKKNMRSVSSATHPTPGGS